MALRGGLSSFWYLGGDHRQADDQKIGDVQAGHKRKRESSTRESSEDRKERESNILFVVGAQRSPLDFTFKKNESI